MRFELGQAEEMRLVSVRCGELTVPSTESSRRTCSAMSADRDADARRALRPDRRLTAYSLFRSIRLLGRGSGAQLVWSAVCWLVIIPLGWLTSRRTRLYRYLWRSVLRFDSIQTFVDRLYRAGFVDVEVRTVPGWQRGILHTFRARKPATHFMIIGRRRPPAGDRARMLAPSVIRRAPGRHGSPTAPSLSSWRAAALPGSRRMPHASPHQVASAAHGAQ